MATGGGSSSRRGRTGGWAGRNDRRRRGGLTIHSWATPRRARMFGVYTLSIADQLLQDEDSGRRQVGEDEEKLGPNGRGDVQGPAQ